jgi:hypothetical protein
MARALCLSFYGTPWECTSEFRRSICDNMADAALAALPVTAAQLAEIAAGRAVVVPVEATEWQPIETAPIDEKVLVSYWAYGEPGTERCVEAAYFKGHHWYDIDDDPIHTPTHWRPLPTAPRKGEP